MNPIAPLAISYSAKTPQWAQELFGTILAQASCGPSEVQFSWRTYNRSYTTGSTRSDETSTDDDILHTRINAGTFELDQRLTVIHEAAHCIVGVDYQHGRRFWRTLFPLEWQHDIPVEYSIWCECWNECAMEVAAEFGLGDLVLIRQAARKDKQSAIKLRDYEHWRRDFDVLF